PSPISVSEETGARRTRKAIKNFASIHEEASICARCRAPRSGRTLAMVTFEFKAGRSSEFIKGRIPAKPEEKNWRLESLLRIENLVIGHSTAPSGPGWGHPD